MRTLQSLFAMSYIAMSYFAMDTKNYKVSNYKENYKVHPTILSFDCHQLPTVIEISLGKFYMKFF